MDLLHVHRLCLADSLGQDAYRRAIFRSIHGGETVLDLGTGTGIHALFACQAGAERVYAIEQGDVIHLAKEIALANGFQDRIVFLQGLSTEVELPEKVDLIIAHLGFAGHLSFLIDARKRFLKENGSVIPATTEIVCAPLEWPSAYEERIGIWTSNPHGLDFSPVRGAAVHQIYPTSLDPDRFLAPPSSLARVDFLVVSEAGATGEACFTALRSGTLHGLGIWFDLELERNIRISTAPPAPHPPSLWGQSFLPSREPLSIHPGDRLHVRLTVKAVGGAERVWTWKLTHTREDRTQATFVHSSFLGHPLAPGTLHRQDPTYVPSTTPLGQACRTVLERCDGKIPRHRIEQEVLHLHPACFLTPESAASFVTDVLKRFAR